MDFCIIIPAHNEEEYLGATLDSLANQSHLPNELIIVNDNSTDNTASIARDYASKYKWISVVENRSSNLHMPGSKIIEAFYAGFRKIEHSYDVICKFDADLIFPKDYLLSLANHFLKDEHLGMAAGFCYVEKGGEWKLEDFTREDHIRGALKAYRISCFEKIGGLKRSMGWDTVDELLARYHGYKIRTDKSLKVKHLKPTGINYNAKSKNLQGMAMYKLRYGLTLTLLTALKMGYKKGSLALFSDYMIGYHKAKKQDVDYLVSEDEGNFIRSLRWKGIKSKF